MITQDELKGIVSYDFDTGMFTRLITTCGSAQKGSIPVSKNKDGYYQLRINYKMYTQHRLVWLYVNGGFPNGDIDHINHIRTDNRIVNLRVVDKATNNKNISKRSDNTSGVTGVWWHKQIGKWSAEIMVDGKKKSLGCFHNIDDAAKARTKAINKYNFHENHGS
jgi:hypothetical protein